MELGRRRIKGAWKLRIRIRLERGIEENGRRLGRRRRRRRM